MFTRYEKFVVATLAFLQFTLILDFMIMSPLGAMMMPALKITPTQFGFVVSIYAFSAGASGLLAAGFADRFDRKKLLLFFYVGFLLGTLFCALAPNYEFLLAARMMTGLFGGVIGSIVFAIVTDLFPYERRGQVMGVLQTAFAASQVLGIPIGLYIATHWEWHAPFLMIVFIGALVGVVIAWKLKPIREHLKLKQEKSPLGHLWFTATNPNYLFAFFSTMLLSMGGFMMMPFGTAYTVNNLKIDIQHLTFIYLVTGICSFFAGPLVGRLSDKLGKMRMFIVGTLITAVMVCIYVNLGPSSLYIVMIVNTTMFIGIFSRMIPTQAMISAIPDPQHRGSFMSISSSMQQIAGGFGSILAGYMVTQLPSGELVNFDWVGYTVVAFGFISWPMIGKIHRKIHQGKPN